MTKKYKYSSILFVSLPIAPLVAIACNVNKNSYLDINKISRSYLKTLTGNQVAIFHNQFKIFYFKQDGKRVYYESAEYDENKNQFTLTYKDIKHIYKPDFSLTSGWKQKLNSSNSYIIENSKEKSDIKNFLNDYTFDEIDDANGFNDTWFLALINKYKHDYIREGDPYFEDLQTIIFRVIYNMSINYSYLNSRRMVNAYGKNILKKDLFLPEYMQAKTWLLPEKAKQRRLFKAFLLLYLNKFNVDIKDINIDWEHATTQKSYDDAFEYVKFKIKNIINFKNESIFPDNKKDVEYYINGFRSYATDKKFGVGPSGIRESDLPLFNEYIENPLLKINGGKYMNIVDNINEFIKGATDWEFWNTKGLMYLFQSFKKELFSIDIPENKKDTDAYYEIIDFKFTPYFGTNQLLKAIVRVHKKDGSFKDYSWFSSNFDDHGHRLKTQIIKNTYEDLVSADFLTTKTLLSHPKWILLKDFLNSETKKYHETKAFYPLLKKAVEKMRDFKYWNNDERSVFEAHYLDTDSFQTKVLASYINNYLLSYALNDEDGIINPLKGIKRIDVEILPTPYEAGRIKLKLKFVKYNEDHDDFDFKSDNEKIAAEVTFYWNGFKGFDKNISENVIDIEDTKIGGI